jgi:hypothetical protein
MRVIVAFLIVFSFLAGCSFGPRAAHAPTEIPWARAEEIILAGEVVELEPREDGTVRLHLTDGRHLVATEPAAGAARAAIEKCGARCAAVKMRG